MDCALVMPYGGGDPLYSTVVFTWVGADRCHQLGLCRGFSLVELALFLPLCYFFLSTLWSDVV